ncbi:hypothetical protein FN846DRAFT_785833 [Sphaerosporella brunnea]|uniref:DUF7580 domain-containing protein n=1 Tax=Sphaerosporella brunnea TaxID=1250544 RepID=A0A5J5EIT0_9PEZI|nr:hypothetical protein FN846DRAFT_785833 [Sphaerosporella brunnea]
MVTGIEAAGLALGIFPILIKGIRFYIDGVGTIKDWWRYKGVLSRLVRQLETEQLKFENTCGHLLEGLVTAGEATDLVGGIGWDNPAFQEILGQRHNPKMVKVFTESVQALHRHLEQLSKDVGVFDNSAASSLDKKTRKRFWKSLKLVLQQNDHNTLLQAVRQINEDLSTLTMQRIQTVIIQKPAQDLAKHYNRCRSYAKSLYDVFQERLLSDACQCAVPHTASLRLQATSTTALINEDNQRPTVYFGFENTMITGKIPGDWRALEFEPFQRDTDDDQYPAEAEKGDIEHITMTYATALASAEHIENLCSAVERATSPGRYPENCMGILIDRSNGWLHRVFPPSTVSCSCFLPTAISLEELLSLQCLSMRKRLELGLRLASALLKLHETGWWNENWGKRDIFFLQKKARRQATDGRGIIEVCDPIVDEPLVRRAFSASARLGSSPPPKTTSSSPVEYDRSLCSLGIILIELWYQCRIEDLRSPHQLQNHDDEFPDYETAQNRLGKLMTDAGESYGLAVSRSLGGLNGPVGVSRHVAKSLKDNLFTSEVHENIVCLLEKNLEVPITANSKQFREAPLTHVSRCLAAIYLGSDSSVLLKIIAAALPGEFLLVSSHFLSSPFSLCSIYFKLVSRGLVFAFEAAVLQNVQVASFFLTASPVTISPHSFYAPNQMVSP